MSEPQTDTPTDRADFFDRVNEMIQAHGACAVSEGVVRTYWVRFIDGLAKLTTEYYVTTTVFDNELYVILRHCPRGEVETPTLTLADTGQ